MPDFKKPAKMQDVAELAGVSIKTVSRVFNNEPHVKEKVRKTVREAAKQLNYIPSQSARSLRGSRFYDINLVGHAPGNNYFNSIQFGAVIACQEQGYRLSISILEDLTSKSVAEVRAAFGGVMTRHRPDGIMLVAPYAGDEKIELVLQELNIPVARIGPVELNNKDVLVQIDDYQAAIEVTEHLTKLGHKRIGFVRGDMEQSASHARYAGFCVALEKAGLTVEEELVKPGNFFFEDGFKAGGELMALRDPPTAIFAANDDMAAGVVAACNAAGLSVPQNVSIVGFDDGEIATRMHPNLTTVSQPLHELGAVAARELIARQGKAALPQSKRIVLDHKFVIRGTTARPS